MAEKNSVILVVFRFLTAVLLVAFLVSLVLGWSKLAGPFLVSTLFVIAFFCMLHPRFKKIAFTAWVFVAVAASMNWPSAFGSWFGFNLGLLIVPLIQLIMFGMGTTLNMSDFSRVFKMPWPVIVGLVLQFTIMPVAGLSLALLFGFEPEVAAGIVLIGSCPGGVASNLMTYLAGGNVALSVTMTSCSTLISPVMTPFLMKTLAGKFVPINFTAMMLSILNMIIVPIIAGLIANRILYSKKQVYNRPRPLFAIALVCLVLAVLLIAFSDLSFGVLQPIRPGVIIGLMLIGIVALAKLIVSIWLKGPENWMDKTLPLVSMFGIVYIIAIITARSSEKLLTVGFLLIAAAIIHNFIGYILGYWISRGLKLNEKTCRTVAFEVGMQNGGMASGLAMTVLNSANAALAPAIFGPWMNISGSVLSTWWHRKPVKDEASSKVD
jgi:bile acid:Na+ symporter, BASS family